MKKPRPRLRGSYKHSSVRLPDEMHAIIACKNEQMARDFPHYQPGTSPAIRQIITEWHAGQKKS